jgi:hypothetical protein
MNMCFNEPLSLGHWDCEGNLLKIVKLKKIKFI